MTARADPRFREPACLFYGIGAQKAGTTWLHDYLSSHPDVAVPAMFKEQQYWNSVRPPHNDFILPESQSGRIWERTRIEILSRIRSDPVTTEWAARQRGVLRPRDDHRDHATAILGHWQGEHAVGEITPAYALLGQETFAEMAGLSDNVRFIFIMRDPIDRVLSAARMYHRQGKGAGPVIEQLIAAIDAEDAVLLAQSDYKRTITRLEAVVPRDRIAYLFYETLFDQTEIDRLCAHLGVSSHPADTDKVVFSYRDKTDDAVPVDVTTRLAEKLMPVYEFIRARFGEAVPDNWAA